MSDTSAFQPLFPEERMLGPLHDLSAQVIDGCFRLGGHGVAPVAAALREKLRAMNSYYSNRIEGQHTRPADIERALRKDFDAVAGIARKQRLAIAHMAVEDELERSTAESPPAGLFSEALVKDIHARLYGKLPVGDRVTEQGQPVEPGQYRQRDVAAGLHIAPPWQTVAGLMQACAARYGQLRGKENLLIGAACAHHRLAWVHPFIDGNGRTARLQTHLVLHAAGLTQGLWSPMRGFARTQEQYYALLNNADLPRRNDLDGRGPLSQEELVAFTRYFLQVCLDQVQFMRARLDLQTLKDRLQALLLGLQARPWEIGSEKSVIKLEALEPLHYVALTGALERARFIAMTGLEERTGRRVLASLLDYGILQAETARAPVGIAIPLKSLGVLFPNLWPEVDTD